MLRRIAVLKGIGPFANCTAGAVEFRKTSLVFGYNSYGKSTLCEVIRSLETRDTTELTVRGTIPGPIVQHATITFAEDGKSELPVSLKDSQWSPATPGPFRVQVFDSAFVSRNLFTGGRAERSNKEALSRFVLGEQGVKQANEIADLRKRWTATKAAWRKLQTQLQGVGDVDEFVNLEIKQTEDELKAELQPLVVALDQARRNLASVQQIQSRPVLSSLATQAGDSAVIERLNAALSQSMSDTHETARTQLNRHVREHMGGHRSGVDWVRQGLEHVAGPLCPFCEQPLERAPEGLLDAYRGFFDDAFRRQSADVLEALGAFEKAVQSWGAASHETGLQKNSLVLAEYRELEEQEAFREMRARFDQLGEAVVDTASTYERVTGQLREAASVAIQRKRDALHESIDALDLTAYRAAHERAVQAMDTFNVHCTAFNKMLVEFKTKSDKATLSAEVTKLEGDIQINERRRRRLSSAVTCEEYRKAKDLDPELENLVRTAEETLTKEQSAYLSAFFDRINHYFTQFGSKHFAIATEEKMDMLGYQPVLSLVVKYHGVVIEPQLVGSVFSESDRRALALSIFWAKLSILTDAERALTIAVLDDPVTSFDDNRVSTSVMLMRYEATSLRQLMLFTHYHAFARRWLEVERTSGALSFHQLTRDDKTTTLADANPDEFLQSEQEKLYRKFIAFIDGKINDAIGGDLRVYFESEIRERYRQHLASGSMQAATLSDAISYLAQTRAISAAVATKAHHYREDLNLPHHLLTARGREDWASLARQLLDFIYTEL